MTSPRDGRRGSLELAQIGPVSPQVRLEPGLGAAAHARGRPLGDRRGAGRAAPRMPHDPMLPLMIWYGIEPLVRGRPRAGRRAGGRLQDSRSSAVRRASRRRRRPGPAWPYCWRRVSRTRPTRSAATCSAGILDALRGRKRIRSPPGWADGLRRSWLTTATRTCSSRRSLLALDLGEPKAVEALRRSSTDRRRPLDVRTARPARPWSSAASPD